MKDFSQYKEVGKTTNTVAKGEAEVDRWRAVVTDGTLMTSMPGLFGAGDVRAGSTKQAASSAGEGATAALMIRQYIQTIGQMDKQRKMDTIMEIAAPD